jgi:hypothetical protein
MKRLIYSVLLSILFIGCLTQSYGQNIRGTYAIKNVETGLLLRIKDANNKDTTPLVAYPASNWKCMTWDFQQVEGEAYQLRNLFTGKTFQPVAKAKKEGVALEQMPLSKGDETQEWEFIPVSKDIYQIRLKNSNLYLTPSDEHGEVNSPIILSGKKQGQIQNWTIYLQVPKM